MDITTLAMAKSYADKVAGNGGGSNNSGVGTGSSDQNHTVDEKVIGTWIDGKPLYRKSMFIDLSSYGDEIEDANTYLVDMTEFNIDKCVRFDGMAQYAYTPTGGSGFLPLNFYQKVGSIDLRLHCYYSSNKKIGFGYSTSSTSTRIYGENTGLIIVMEYTKTTDEATESYPTAEAINNAYVEGVQSA